MIKIADRKYNNVLGNQIFARGIDLVLKMLTNRAISEEIVKNIITILVLATPFSIADPIIKLSE